MLACLVDVKIVCDYRSKNVPLIYFKIQIVKESMQYILRIFFSHLLRGSTPHQHNGCDCD